MPKARLPIAHQAGTAWLRRTIETAISMYRTLVKPTQVLCVAVSSWRGVGEESGHCPLYGARREHGMSWVYGRPHPPRDVEQSDASIKKFGLHSTWRKGTLEGQGAAPPDLRKST